MIRSSRAIGGLVGILLGFAALAGYIFFRMFQVQQISLDWIRQEVISNALFYIYITTTIPVVFAVFGFILGHLRDKVFSQKSDLERLAVRLKHQSMTDDVTGLYNHRHILVEIEREVERANRYGRILSGMMIDIDDFKKVNDQYGHLSGDLLLREVAQLLEQSIRKVDILGRYGGDEFLVILPESTFEAAKVVAERVQRNFQGHVFSTKEGPLSITVSIGLFSFQDLKKIDRETFIEKADQALLRAKQLGKNTVFAEQGE